MARARVLPTVVVVAALAAAFLALRTIVGTDYPGDAGPSIDALLRFDLGAFFGHQPQMGQLSLWLRWPFAAIGDAAGGDLAAYRAGALACLAAPVGLAAWLAAGSRNLTVGLVAVLALVANPV